MEYDGVMFYPREHPDDIVTSDLARFGHRERVIAGEILWAWNTQGLPADFEDGYETRIMFNTQSGYVFLDNGEACQTAVMEGRDLVMFYCLGYQGIEGTLEELEEEFKANGETWHEEDIETFRDIQEFHNKRKEAQNA